MDKIDELDCSWIIEEESRGSGNIVRENLDSIRCKFIYTSLDNSIIKIIKEKEDLVIINSSHHSKGILNDRLLQIIQNKRFLDNGQRYKIINLVKFLIDIEPQKISTFVKSDIHNISSVQFLKELNFFGNILIEPSIVYFHSLATLYFFFKEDDILINPVKSILKTNTGNSRTTKKVRILEDVTDTVLCNKKTKKVRI
jgi:TATA-binding protein-associated factor Taf7